MSLLVDYAMTVRNGAAARRYGLSWEERALIRHVRRRRLSYCEYPRLEHICARIRQVRMRAVEGAYVEAGVALGGSAILLARLKPARAALLLYDVFGMIPPPGAQDGPDAHQRYREIASGASGGIGHDRYYGYVPNLQDVVRQNLAASGVALSADKVSLVPGQFADTMSPQEPIAFAHIDCDWYDSVKTCIERLTPRLATGGVMVFDDYGAYSGCRRAVDEYLRGAPPFAASEDAGVLTIEKLEPSPQ